MLTLIKALLIVFFVIPLIAACLLFVFGAMWIQSQEESSNG